MLEFGNPRRRWRRVTPLGACHEDAIDVVQMKSGFGDEPVAIARTRTARNALRMSLTFAMQFLLCLAVQSCRVVRSHGHFSKSVG
jgi:hypothetical protein